MEIPGNCLPSHTKATPAPSYRPDWLRPWRLLAIWSVVIASILGAAIILQIGFALSEFGALESVPSVVSLSIVRKLGASAATSSVVFALVHWTHRYKPDQLQKCLRRGLVWGFSAGIVTLPIVIMVSLASSFGTGLVVYGIDWPTFSSAAAHTLMPVDFAVGLGTAIATGLFLTLVVGFVLPIFARLSWNLPAKLSATWAVLVAINVLFSAVAFALP
jgi:hypothetical protein